MVTSQYCIITKAFSGSDHNDFICRLDIKTTAGKRKSVIHRRNCRGKQIPWINSIVSPRNLMLIWLVWLDSSSWRYSVKHLHQITSGYAVLCIPSTCQYPSKSIIKLFHSWLLIWLGYYGSIIKVLLNKALWCFKTTTRLIEKNSKVAYEAHIGEPLL